MSPFIWSRAITVSLVNSTFSKSGKSGCVGEVKDYQELQTLVEEISQLEWRRLTRREE